MKATYVSTTNDQVLSLLTPDRLMTYIREVSELESGLQGWDLTDEIITLGHRYLSPSLSYTDSVRFSHDLYNAVQRLRVEIENVSRLLGLEGQSVVFQGRLGGHFYLSFKPV